MKAFAYQRTTDPTVAIAAAAGSNSCKFLAGGTNLVDLMKDGVENPERLIDINRLPLANIEPLGNGGLRLGALARNSDTANHHLVRQNYPLLSRAILSGASPQLRNLATNGGNLLQRTRCWYFMDVGSPQCNKRAPGTGCGAIEGLNRSQAILGTSDKCIATHPSDMAVALTALEAGIRIQGPHGERTIPIADFYRLPGDTPWLDTNLEKNDLILSIDLPPSPYAVHSCYLKIRDRASYEFALVSVAAALEIENGKIRSVRIALGGVAPKPWRCEGSEKILEGREPSEELFESAGAQAVKSAKPYKYNAFKVEMAKRAVVRALSEARGVA